MIQKETTTILKYQGSLTFETIEEILVEYKKRIESFDVELVIRKRIYSILVECLENTYRHNIDVNNKPKHNSVELELYNSENGFEIKVGNYIRFDSLDSLLKRIKQVNSLSKEGLNKLYRESIAKARISDKGGAGLGIIEIARNSREIIKYELSAKEGDHAFFSFIVSVNK